MEKVSSLSNTELRALVKEAGLSSDDCMTYSSLRLRGAEAVERLLLPGAKLGPISKKLGLGAEADPKIALVLAKLTACGVASGAVDAVAIAAELQAQGGHVGRTVNRLMNRLRAAAPVEAEERAAAAATPAATGAAEAAQPARQERESRTRAAVEVRLSSQSAPAAAKAVVAGAGGGGVAGEERRRQAQRGFAPEEVEGRRAVRGSG